MTTPPFTIRTGIEKPTPLTGAGRQVVLAIVPCVIAVLFAVGYYLPIMRSPASMYPPFTDAITYLAAGERLNAGHELYALGPGDRPVSLELDLSPSPLFSPPPIAVLWRPLAPFGFGLWIAAVWVVLLGTLFYVGRRGFLGLALALLLSKSVGEQLAVANVAAFFPALMILAWRGSGTATGLMAVVKITPGALLGYHVARRQWRAVGAAVAVGVAALVLTLVAAPGSIGAYLGLAKDIAPSGMSLSGLSGIAWLSPAVLVGGTLFAACLGRWPALSFAAAVLASTLGTPALYLSSLVPLLALAAPLGAGLTYSIALPRVARPGRPTSSRTVGADSDG